MADSDGRAPRALLLAAGLGIRLRPLTCLRAKAVVPINGEPLAARAIGWLGRAAIRDLVLNLHYRPATITSRIGDGADRGARVRYSWEQPLLGSAGGPRHALPLLVDRDDDDFLIVNADTLTDLDVWSLIRRHRESGALVTMALIENPRPEQYGGVLVTPDGWVAGFTAPTASAGGRFAASRGGGPYHFIGVQVAQASVFASLADGVPAESVNALYPALIANDPRSIAAHISRASFLDIGTPRDCLETSLALAEAEGARLAGAHADVHPTAALVRSVLWDDVSVGRDASLRNCVVGDGARIPVGARYESCAIVPADGLVPQGEERIDGELLVKEL
jgi:NDP-sugar pyrophosphorylase family protein